MKKVCLFLVLMLVIVSLTSCQINWFGGTVDAPWYYVVIPIVTILIFAYIILMSQTYICPRCKTEFKAKPYQLYVTIHCNGERIAKCPCCKRRGFCKVRKK